MDRKDQLEFCKICLNRTFSPKQGIICKLTHSKANFIDSCDDYLEDSKTVFDLNNTKAFKNRVQPDFMFGLDYLGIKSGVTAGSIVIIIGFLWLIFGFTKGLIYFRPMAIILFGTIAVIISSINSYRRKNRELK